MPNKVHPTNETDYQQGLPFFISDHYLKPNHRSQQIGEHQRLLRCYITAKHNKQGQAIANG